MHPIEHHFLSDYVDDYKMADTKDHCKAMLKSSGLKIDLEAPAPLDGNVYPGCGQTTVTPDKQFIIENTPLVIDLMSSKKSRGRRATSAQMIPNEGSL